VTEGSEVRVVDDVPAAFAGVLASCAPRTLALSGGGTAERCYLALREAGGLEWEELTVLFGDERWVPVDDPDSNEGMARGALLDHVPVRAVHSLRGAGVDLTAAADAYDALVASLGRLDVVHLGLGPDGHTASLFPGNASLAVDDRLVVATGDDAHPHPRLTLTYPGIARADVAVVTVEGADKAEAWRRVQADDDVPAAGITAGEVVWLVDPAAAGRVEGPA
jgi:6-phosphogluconolactonase